MAICADRTTLSHDCSYLISAAELSLNQNKFAVMQGDSITLDYVFREFVIGKVSFECANDGAAIWLGWHVGFALRQNVAGVWPKAKAIGSPLGASSATMDSS